MLQSWRRGCTARRIIKHRWSASEGLREENATVIAQPGDRIPNPIAAAQQLHAGVVAYRRTEVRRNEDAGLNLSLKSIILSPSP